MIGVRSSRSFGATIDSVWRDVLDVELHPGFVDDIFGVKILGHTKANERRSAWTVAVGDATISWIAADEIDHASRRLRFSQVIGPFDFLGGLWSVESGTRTAVSLDVSYSTTDADLTHVLGSRGEHLQLVLDRWLLALEQWTTVPFRRPTGS